jgi:hypothetical protein
MALNLSESLSNLKRINCREALFKNVCIILTINFFGITTLFILDNLTAFSAFLRFLLLLFFTIINILMILKLCRDLHQSRLTDKEAAVKLEKNNGIKDNSLINAVCFRDDKNISEDMRSLFMHAADHQCSKIKLSGITSNQKCRKLFKIFIISLLIFLLYIIPLRRYAYNAALRFSNPWSQLASLNFTQFKVTPGDIKIVSGQKMIIKATAIKDGEKINNLKILITSSVGSTLYQMQSSQGISVFELDNVTENLSYKIQSGIESTREFKVKIVPSPEFKKFRIETIPPVYTNLKKTVYDFKSTEISAPKGSIINLQFENSPGNVAEINLSKDKTHLSSFSFTLNKNTTASASITREGIKYSNIWQCKFDAQPDSPPIARFMNRQLNIEAGIGQMIPLYITAEDNYGISSVRVVLENQGRKGAYKQFNYHSSQPERLREVVALKLTPEMCAVGTTLKVSIQALDTQIPALMGQSKANITIHVVDLTKKLKENISDSKNADIYQILFETIEKQQTTRNWLSVKAKRTRRHEIYQLVSQQREIKNLLISAGNKADKVKIELASDIKEIADGIAEKIISGSKNLFKVCGVNNLHQAINMVVNDQSLLIQQVKALLEVAAAREIADKEQEKQLNREEQEKELYEKIKNVRDKLDEFMKEQKQIITETETIDKKEPEDWSEAEEKLLGDLAARELDWSKFFKAAFNDLSKLQNQDFSNSAMADEFVEMYEELQKAGDALAKKNIKEIATLAENTALSSSESVAANLDRWLADNKDSIKWNAEESGESPDIPLTDLPAELTDIIGDLIETEDDMGEDTQDSTNSFSYSSDEGLGWGVGDGNIDSMQAKGITGNILPNNNEVGGRSGEGRSGKSSGQFVEKTATGKGGRKTPTRLTQSPYEKGTVEDTSKDPQGGASGGGKQSGVGNEGLIGITPDQDPNIEERLSGTQGELRQRAEALLRELGKRQLPTGDLREALNKLALLPKQGGNVNKDEIARLKREIAVSLRNAKTSLVLSINAGHEKVRRQKLKDFRVKYQQQEKVPPEYQDCVSGYFKALAKEE